VKAKQGSQTFLRKLRRASFPSIFSNMSDWAKGLMLLSVCKSDQNHFDTFEN